MLAEDIQNYTTAIVRCITPLYSNFGKRRDVPLDHQTTQLLSNMIQGLFLEHLVKEICTRHKVYEEAMEKKLLTKLMMLLREDFFGFFREKVGKNPNLILQIAQEIFSNHCHNTNTEEHASSSKEEDKAYMDTFRLFFSSDLDKLCEKIETHPEVQELVLQSRPACI